MTGTVSTASIWLNKSFATNAVAAVFVLLGLLLPDPLRRPLLRLGLFALSGALTNWLAIHMLFEKVPGLYGSGVIPARFEAFKHEIRRLVMEQFFSPENVDRFWTTSAATGRKLHFDFDPIIDRTDVTPAFEALVATVETSRFGGMLKMAGGVVALEPLKEPFAARVKEAFKALAKTAAFQDTVRSQLTGAATREAMLERIEAMVQQRLEELTPQMVKDIVQQMIHEHLGWLVVWGGVFGGLIGLLTAFVPFF
jgi:uncharacterized membrane-anchored protein YjiN (DUF445 family)